MLFLNNNYNGLNGNNNLDNNGRFVVIGRLYKNWDTYFHIMNRKDDFKEIYSYENLELALKKARKGKTTKSYVIKFENNLKENLIKLSNELKAKTYRPRPLKTFILRDPKTRKISKPNFRDRIVHHALCNIIEPSLDKNFIYDSYANRKGKGTFKAIKRFNYFKRKASKNNTRNCFVLKADIKQYFETVDHEILISILKKEINNKKIIKLIRAILKNYKTKENRVGMPLGNLTSQFFANVYLNELDQFVKHKLKAKYYIRYVDDFAILDSSREKLRKYKTIINEFLKNHLNLELHKDKSKVLKLNKGIGFLGFTIFFNHKLIRKKNLNRFMRKFEKLKTLYERQKIDRDKVVESFEGWLAHIEHANTYKYRRHLTRLFNQCFPIEKVTKVNNAKKHENFIKKVEATNIKFSAQKTLQLFNKGLSIKQIAKKRDIKESTVWNHLVKLIEYHQLPIWKVIPRKKVLRVSSKIYSISDKLKDINKRINDDSITFDEINCVLAYIRSKTKKKNVCHIINWYRKTQCFRKCYFNKKQRKECHKKFKYFISNNPNLELKKGEFIDLFNNHMSICILSEKEKKQ